MRNKTKWIFLSVLLMSIMPVLFAQPLDGFTIKGGTLSESQAVQFPIYYRDVSGTPIDTGNRFVGAFELHFSTNGNLLQSASFERAGVIANASVLIEIDDTNLAENRLRWSVLFSAPPVFNLDQPEPGDLIGYLNLTAKEGSAGQTIPLNPVDEGVFVTEEVGTPTLYLSDNELFGIFETIQVQGGVGNPPPAINRFTITPGSITSGQSASVAWDVTNADTVTIDQGVGVVGNTGSLIVSPTQTTTYTLTATNGSGQATRTASLTVDAPPNQIAILNFSSSPTSINAGQSSVLSWNVENAENIRVERSGSLIVTTGQATGNTTVFPDETTTYTLTATADGLTTQTANATVTVATSSQVAIEAFAADQTSINFQETTRIAWLVTGASSVRLTETPLGGNPIDLGVQSANGERIVQPLVNTQYTITGTGSDGTASKTISVTVAANDSLKVSPGTLALDESDTNGQIEISNVINRPLLWHVQSTPEWLALSETSGSVSNSVQRITITPNRNLLVDGTNMGEIVFASGEQRVSLPVTVASNGENNTVFVYPYLKSDGINTTTFSLVNLEQTDIDYRLDLFNQDGSIIGTKELGTMARLASKTWTFSGAANGLGWARIIITNMANATLSGTIIVRSIDGEELYSYSPIPLTQGNIFVPHLAKDTAFFTQGALVNVARAEDQFQFSAGDDQFDVGALTTNQQRVFDFRTELLDGNIPVEGWGNISSGDSLTAVSAAEIFGRSDSNSRQTVAVSLDGQSAQRIWFPHLAADVSQFWTGVVIINPNSQAVTVTYSGYDSEGALVQSRAPETYAPGQKRTFLVDASVQSFGEGASWLSAESDNGPLLGYMLYGSFPSVADRFSGFQSAKTIHPNLCFPHVEQATVPGSYTGLAVVNVEEATNNVQFRLIDVNGQTKAQEFVLLRAHQKYVNLARNIFADYLEGASFQKDDKIIVLGNRPLVGFEVFGNGTKTMSSVLAIGYE